MLSNPCARAAALSGTMPSRSRLAGRTRWRGSIPRSIGTLRREVRAAQRYSSVRAENLWQPVVPSEPSAHAAIAARNAGTAAPPKKNRIGAALRASKSCCRCGSPGFGLGSGVGLSGVSRYIGPGKVRVLFVLRQKRQTATATVIPGKTIYKDIPPRNPSAATNKEESSERQSELEPPAPASTPLLQPTLLPPCRLQQRAGLKGNFANSPKSRAI